MLKCLMISSPLTFHISQCIQRPPLLKFVQRDGVRKIKHIDFFQLGSRAIFRGHHVDGEVHKIHNLTVTLPNASGLNNDEIKPGCLKKLNA